MKPRIGIKDIARRAGVSKGTVDRVLHERGNVSPSARRKVLTAMQELDYQPNVIASALASNRVWKIAVLIPDPRHDIFWAQPEAGILRAKRALRDYGVRIDFYPFRDADPAHFVACAERILEQDYHALLLSPSFTKEGHQILDACEAQQLPYIQINTFLERDSDCSLAYIGQDSYASGRLAGKLLHFGIEANAQAMVLHLEKAAYNAKHLVDKEEGFTDFFAEHPERGIEVVKQSFGNVHDKARLEQFLHTTLTNYPRSKGIFVTTSKVFHIVPILEKLGRSDIKLVGFDLIDPNLEYLYTDQLHFLINQNPYKQGFMGIVNLFNHLALKKDVKPLHLLPLDVVMQENVQYYVADQNEALHIVI